MFNVGQISNIWGTEFLISSGKNFIPSPFLVRTILFLVWFVTVGGNWVSVIVSVTYHLVSDGSIGYHSGPFYGCQNLSIFFFYGIIPDSEVFPVVCLIQRHLFPYAAKKVRVSGYESQYFIKSKAREVKIPVYLPTENN